jgi:uncharacterized protein
MNELINAVTAFIARQHGEDHTGHDWHHIRRVTDMALFLQTKEGGDRNIIHLAALLHDVSDHKLNGGILDINGKTASNVILDLGGDFELANKIGQIVNEISFKGALVKDNVTSLESKIVQDADRLDSIGAIGIARAFAFGGSKNRPIYQPEVGHELHNDFETYANAKSHTINHFYEKLLLLKSRLHTPTAIHIGQERHDFMESYLQQFYREWNGKND